MARFQCPSCSGKGECEYTPHRHNCRLCGSADVVLRLLSMSCPRGLVAALLRAERLDDDDDED